MYATLKAHLALVRQRARSSRLLSVVRKPLGLAVSLAVVVAAPHPAAEAQSLTAPLMPSVTLPSQTQITISWNDPNTQEAGYILQQAVQGTGSWTKIAQTGPNATFWSSTSVSLGTSCSYRIKAYAWVGSVAIYSPFSPVSTASGPCIGPATPSNLTASGVSQTQIRLTWQDNASDEDGYLIFRTPTGMGVWTQIATAGTNQTTYTDSNLSPGAYNYKVRSYNIVGKSAQSNVATGNTAVSSSSGGQVQWSERFGGTSPDAGTAVTVDDSGNILIAGTVAGAVDFGGGAVPGIGSSGFIAKYSSSREYRWAKRFDGSQGSSTIFAIATDSSGNVYVTGYFISQVDLGGGFRTSFAYPRLSNHDVFIASYTANGAYRWDRTFGSGFEDSGYAIAVTSNGDIIVTGQSADADLGCGYQTSSSSSPDIFLARYSGSNGSCQWAKFVGGSAQDAGLGVAAASNGDIVIAGYFQGSANFGGVTLTSLGLSDIFLARYSGQGNLAWAKRFGNTGDDKANALSLDDSGNIAIGGYFSGTVDFGTGPITSQGSWDSFAAKFTSSGAAIWAKDLGGTDTDEVFGVATDTSGNVVVVGAFKGTMNAGGATLASNGYWDGFAAKYSAASGAHIWSKSFGGIYDDLANAVATDASGNAIVTGYFSATADFGGPEGSLTCAGPYTDIFVLSVGP
jgi:hypothetical protein